jgi:hypothetical protein
MAKMTIATPRIFSKRGIQEEASEVKAGSAPCTSGAHRFKYTYTGLVRPCAMAAELASARLPHVRARSDTIES